MTYVEQCFQLPRTVHDADSHIMELPETLASYIDERFKQAFFDTVSLTKSQIIMADAAEKLHLDAGFTDGAAENLLLRKNHQALGAYRNADRPQALDLLGFSSQLVFTTYVLSNFGLEYSNNTPLALATARAHNRMMADFCKIDKRLLATGYVPLVDIEQAPVIAKQALDLGCKALVIPSRCPQGHSPSHIGFDSLWALAQEAGVPILFHVGGEEKMQPAYSETGLDKVKDFHGGDENFTASSFMTIPLSFWQTMAVFIFDGVCDRFPHLKFGAIELGASWLPSWLRYMDAAYSAFKKGEPRLQKLRALPSDIAKQQVRVTPYCHENVAWIIEQSSADMLMFSSDYPHIEGGRNPIKRFNESLGETAPKVVQKFYRDNFISLMGAGLDAALHDHPNAA